MSLYHLFLWILHMLDKNPSMAMYMANTVFHSMACSFNFLMVQSDKYKFLMLISFFSHIYSVFCVLCKTFYLPSSDDKNIFRFYLPEALLFFHFTFKSKWKLILCLLWYKSKHLISFYNKLFIISNFWSFLSQFCILLVIVTL